MTDVDGLLDGNGELVTSLGTALAAELRQEGVLTGGMIPKVDACFRAAETGTEAFIANGTLPGTLRHLFTDHPLGTRVGVN
jgi:acetylglutamate kinase